MTKLSAKIREQCAADIRKRNPRMSRGESEWEAEKEIKRFSVHELIEAISSALDE